MRAVLLIALAACTDHRDPVMPDAGLERDAGITGNGTATEPCYFWDGPTKCAPKCINKTLLGRPTFGPGCEISPGIFCKTENMTGIAGQGGGCCWESEAKTVDFYPCL